MHLGWVDIISFAAFLLAVLVTSMYASRKEENTDDYFLAGRSLSWWMIGISLIASNISTEHFVGMAGQGFRKDIGLAIASYEWIAALALILVALFLLPRFLKAGIYTIPEFLEYRYNKWPRTIMSAGLLIMYATVTMATVLYAGGLAIHSIFGIDIQTGVWGLGIFTGLYTVFGGLKAVVWTDVIQGSVLLLGGAVVTILALIEVGGIDEFIRLSDGRLHTVLPADHPELPWTAVFIGGMWLPNIFYWGLNQFITQRALGAKNLEEGQKGILLGATIKLFIPMIVVFPGIIAYELYGDQITTADAAFPFLAKQLLPAGLTGIVLAALLGATMSTLDSLLNSAATIFTIDFYKQFFRQEAAQKHFIRVGRITTVVLVIIACLSTRFVASYTEGLYKFIQIWWGCIQPGIVAAFFMGLLWNKVPPIAAVVGMLLNIPLYLILLSTWKIAFLHHMAICFVTICFVMGIITLFYPMQREIIYPVHRNFSDTRLSPALKLWSALIVMATIALYYIFR
ncbi:MAG: transporter [Chitinophagales bacterium]|nr:MAG: transporter [Chitinophagales bacterium]